MGEWGNGYVCGIGTDVEIASTGRSEENHTNTQSG
jgi:hypothetical protein